MKHLYLCRHGQSEMATGQMRDFDRVLNEQGLLDVAQMAQLLRQQAIKPDLIISSDAKRALSTAMIIAKALAYPDTAIKQASELYAADKVALLNIIHELPENYHSVMIFGHNPTFSELAYYLSPQVEHMLSPGSICGLEFDTQDWFDINYNQGKLILFEQPS